ncbi:PREDICTED: LOW QUALITY PROTEIN: von Willebrand factor A domain-containing protein 3B [Phaethon lepturus]|uniref:LOW QUALITY PROTEIN: von Willebrand factor A domain-containing protein 3B n=1 Tax=Phaethon lepturus TaxID=97097 RepID=UPI000530A78A|nr:PREDICTED: LOW QUALITY PROTEIN: von Willebrand factor A domain-containing protein 3B [Phaethon lepturus]
MTGNPSKTLAWSDYSFDSKHRQDPEDSHQGHKKKSKEKESRLAVSQWDMDVQPLVSSSKWLHLHGLKRKKLSLSQILSQIGFQRRKDYVTTLGKLVASQYADGLFPQYKRTQDGCVYNLTAKKELILHFVDCLMRAVELYKQRMEWLTSESRQIFGVIQEQCIVIVLDFGTAAPTEFDLCRDALSMVLVEQVTQIAKFNLIRAAQDLMKWQQKSTLVSEHTVKSAVTWLWKLDHMTAASHTSSAEALLEAMTDEAVEAVYYFAVGDVPVDTKQLLLEKVSHGPCPVNTVSFNAREDETIIFLKELSHLASGRFHAFTEKNDYRDATGPALKCGENGKGLIALNSRKVKGQMPLVGVHEDVFLIWKELEEARSTLGQVQKILSESDQPASRDETKAGHPLQRHTSDKYLTSEKWLQKYGLKAQKLTLYDALADCTFRHADGIVDIKTKPEDESSQTDAETKRKVIHAKYCDKFVHTFWKDGSVIHIYVSTEKYKQYEEKMRTALRQVEGRIKWLQQGSRGLFGNVFADDVYILIDTSQSMKDKLPLVKEKIFQLIQEQLRYKKRFNFVKFSAQAVAWQEKLAEVNEENLQDAWLWIKGLEVGSSTNTLKALQIALADTDTQAIYLLTDGRPDQPPQIILAQVQLHRKIPIHTVSFNCDDIEANKFLYELSTETEGRFHYYNIYLTDPDAPDFIVNEDIHLLKREIEQGERDLEKVKTFHAECLMMDCYNGENDPENNNHKQTRMVSSVTEHIEELSTALSSRPCCASEEPALTPHQQTWQTTADSPAQRKKALYAEQTKTSLLRILSHSAKSREESPEEGISPEKKSFSVKKGMKCTSIFKGKLTEQEALYLKMQKAVKRTSKSSLEISSALWLKTHGLVARRLTIMDALAPTAVPHGTKYIPVLAKHAVSKVFNEMLPLAHVSNDKKQITLINPQAVNLDAYKEKLEQAIKSYERRLNLVIWRALSQEERDKFKEDGPVQYMQHKEALLEALENLGWPISCEDVMLLEDEILAALTYIQQASDLQEAVKKETEKSSESHISSNKKRLEEETVKSKSKKRQKGQVFVTHKSQKVIARSDVTGFYYPGTVIKNISSSCALVDFSNGETWIVPVKFTIPVGGAMPCPHLQVGDYVFARTGTQTGNEYYAPAIVIATPKRVEMGDKLYTVLMFNNKKEHCVRSRLIKISQTKYAFSCRYIRRVQMVDYVTLDRETTKAYLHSSVEDGEEAKKSIVKEDRAKNENKRREDKRYPRERMLDCDDLLFVTRREVKQRGRNSLPSNEEEFEACSSRRQTLQSLSTSTPSSPKHPCCLHSPVVESLQHLVKATSPELLQSTWSSKDQQDSLSIAAQSKGSCVKGA